MKTLLNKKTAAALALCLSMSVSTFGQSQVIHLTQNKATVSSIIKAIEKQTQMSVDFSQNTINLNKTVSLKSKSETLGELMNQILKGNGNLTYKIVDRHIIIVKAGHNGAQPEQSVRQGVGKTKITGRVLDNNGEPIIGASVVEQGTKNGTVTDIDGNYTLNVSKENATLSVTYIGFLPQQVKVNGGNSTIHLKEDAQNLNEVVVVGYGTMKKADLTGAVSSVNGTEIASRPVTDATQSLQGLVPGLLVSNDSSGRPGSSGTLTLRGQGNLSGTGHPYVLVDGIEMSLSDVNPNDIENISVLKDAAACAIYGARAAYGVILVTTKRGKEGKSRINYQGTVGWNSPTVLPEMLNSVDFARMWNDGCKNANSSRLYSDEKIKLLEQYINDPSSVNPWQELSSTASMNPAFENSESGIGNVDYFDLHYKDASFKQRHNLSVSGGGKAAQYYTSAGYYKEDGLLRYANIDFERINVSTNLTSQLTPWLKLKAGLKFAHSVQNTPFGDGGLSDGFFHSLARFRPTVSVVDPNGHFTELSMIPYLQSGTYTKTKRDFINMTGGFEINPFKGFNVIMDYTYKIIGTHYSALNVAPMIYAADGVSTSKGVRQELGVTADGKFTRYNANTHYQTINLYGTYNFSINQAHNTTVMAGYQEENNKYDYLRNVITGLYSTTNPNVGMGTGDKVVTDTRNSWATRSFFARVNYDYKSRYLLELNGRYDGSSRFAKDHRWGFFPSVSVGWNLTEEPFMEKYRQVLSQFKVRASIGRLGNQAGAALYTFASTMGLHNGLGGYIFNDGRHIYLNAPGVVNPTTTWEKVDSKNLGIDFGFFGGALSGSFDIFQRDTKDMLGPSVDFPDFFGATAPQTNNAQLRNRGWELTLNYRGKIGNDITYNIGGSLSDATAKVTAYENPTGTNPSANWYKGKMVGEIWGYRTDGLIKSQEQADQYNATHNNSFFTKQKWTPGDVAYRDLDNDGYVNNGSNKLGDMGDMVIVGNTTPRYQYTISGGVNWKGLGMSFIFQGVGKRDWDPTGNVYFWGSSSYAQVTLFKEHLDYWSESNPNAYYPKPYINTAGGVGQYNAKTSRYTTDQYLQSAAYCRLKNLTISYDLPKSLIHKAGLEQVRVFVSGENLFTITSLKGMFDPEVIFAQNSYNAEGGKQYPINKVYSIGLSVSF